MAKKKFDMTKFLGEQAVKQDKAGELLAGVEIPDKHLQALDEKFIVETYRAERTVEERKRVSGPTVFEEQRDAFQGDYDGKTV